MPGKAGAEHYNKPGVKVDEFPEAPPQTRSTFWTQELEKLRAEPMTVLSYPGAKKASGENMRRRDFHIESVHKDDTLYLRWNPDAKEPVKLAPKSNGSSADSNDKPAATKASK